MRLKCIVFIYFIFVCSQIKLKYVILQNIFKLNICFLFWKDRNSFSFLAINFCVNVMREKVSINSMKRVQLHPRVQILSPVFIELLQNICQSGWKHFSTDVLLTKQGYETGDGDFSEHQGARKEGSVRACKIFEISVCQWRIYIDKLCQIFFIFMQFAGAFTQIIGCRSPLGNPRSATVYDNFLLCFFPSLQFRW